MRYLLVTAIVFAFPAIAMSTTIHVPADQPTIQAGIDSAVNGNTVLVAPGTYLENINFLGKAIHVKSKHGPAVTVIDGGDMGVVVMFNGGESSSSIIEGFTITNGYGSGVYCWQTSPKIVGNIIVNNVVPYGGPGGGGIGCSKSTALIRNNIITGNAAQSGGGIDCYESGVTIINNTVVGNKADSGGGISCSHSSYPVVVNSILWDNEAPLGPEIFIGDSSYPSFVIIGYSDVEGGLGSVYEESGCSILWDTGMITDPPEFVDLPGNDLHLMSGSPCRDTGDNTTVFDPVDFEGDPRIAYGTVDMGADEFYRHLYYTGNATPGGSVSLKFVGDPGTAQVGLIIGFDIFDPPIHGAYGSWYMKPPMLLVLGLGPIPSTGVYILPGTLPPTPTGPYTVFFQAMIGMKLTNLCTMNVQ